jgi:CheY-like chemotaxis protein
LALTFTCAGRTSAQPKPPAPKPLEIYAQFRTTLAEGKYDIAGIFLDEFLKSEPADADFLELERKYGTTVFQQLRAVPRYSDDPATEKKIRDDIEELNKRSKAVAAKLLYNPERVQKYIRNLGATYEEKIFAQQELKRTGEFAVPFLIDAIRTNPDKDLYAGIIETIPVLEGPSMAGWVAALDGLGLDRQYGVVTALSLRRDVLNLLTEAQTDFTPYLWRVLSLRPDQVPANMRDLAISLLTRFHPGSKADSKRPEVELVALARKFYEHKARYLGAKTNPDGSPTRVPLWVWDATLMKINRLSDVPVGQADEYYGLRYARWALESKPDYEPAQGLVLSLASERAIERARFGPLAIAEPAVYKLLADAPSAVLGDLLARGLAEKRTALVLAMVQVLGDRADRAAATPPAGPTARPSLLVRALSYPDPSVQFAAATALLRSPVPVPAASRPLIVDVLRRAAAIDPGVPGEVRGNVLLADPVKFRADINALLLRGFGFTVEQFTTGRELLRRVAHASDFDLIFIDHHTASPELIDLIAQLQSDVRTAARPVFVIASSDRPRMPTFDQLLVRTSALIAATENDTVQMPLPYQPDVRLTADEQFKARATVQQRRDNVYRSAIAARTARLQRVIDTLPITLSDAQKRLLDLRIQLIEYALLNVEFPITPESAPETAAELDRIHKQINLQPPVPTYGVGIASDDLLKLIDRFELDVAKTKGAQDRYDYLRLRIDAAELGLSVETFRNPTLEAKLRRTLVEYPAVKVISEPYSRLSLEAEFRTLFADPAMIPRDGANRKAEARTAVEYLKQMAVGDLPGYDLKSAEADLRGILTSSSDPEVVSSALDAVERFKSGEAQQALLRVALRDVRNRPVHLRRKAADAVIRHVRANGNALTPDLIATVITQSDATTPEGEPDAELRGKLLTLKGMLAYKPGAFVDQLKSYTPPIVPPEPKKEPEKKEPEGKM